MHVKHLFQLQKQYKYGIQGIRKSLLNPFLHNHDLNHAIQNTLPLLNHNYYHQTEPQKNVLQFYDKKTLSPYIPLYAKGPWIITETGAVLYDVGGYGMLGFGHSPNWVKHILSKPHVMTNIMTPHRIHQLFTDELQNKIGVHEYNTCPYTHFAFLNSGSECMELAMRITDLQKQNHSSNSKKQVWITLKNGFHGRTHMSAQLSDSCANHYTQYLQSFKNEHVHVVDINHTQDFIDLFHMLNESNHVQAVVMEPVMGEGNPGVQMDKPFYNAVRTLTHEHGSQLVIDSNMVPYAVLRYY